MWVQLILLCFALLSPGFFLPGAHGVSYSKDNKISECESSSGGFQWKMPFIRVNDKNYYIGHFFKANWYKASQYCRYHGLQLASIETKEENTILERYISEIGLGNEHFWTSGTDQAEEGVFYWFGTGKPVGYTNWNAGEPNNFRYENGEEEHCLELWNRDAKGLKWNDTPCSFETYFICELV